MRKKALIPAAVLLSLSFIFFPLSGQPAPGQWRDHLPCSEPFLITLSPEFAWAATKNALFGYNRQDHSIQKFSRVQGLSDMGISCLRYIPEKDLLFVGYENGNIDLIEKDGIYNIADIKRYTQITGNKQINDLLVIEGYAYLSTGFGIVLLDLSKKEIKDSYFVGPNGSPSEVYRLAYDGEYLFAATSTGLLKARQDDPNLVNFEAWETPDDLPVPGAVYSDVLRLGSSMILVRENGENDEVYYQEDQSWILLRQAINVIRCRISNQQLFLVTGNGIFSYSSGFSLLGQLDQYGQLSATPMDVAADTENNLWIADKGRGMVFRNPAGFFEFYLPNGPLTADVWHISARAGRVYAAGGGVDAAWNNVFNSGIVYAFRENSWESLVDYSARDFVRILIDPDDPDHFFAASWGYGISEYQGNQLVKRHDASNSTLQSILPGEDYVRVGGMSFDQNRNLWVTNSGVDHPVSVLTPGGWKSMDYSIDAPTLGDILVNQWGHKWILLPRGYGLFAFDDRGTLDNTDDDLVKKFSILDETGNTITNDVFSMAEDLDGNIWVGTAMGPVVYYNTQNVFTGEFFYATRIKIPGDSPDQANYLLENEVITSIAIDGGNRKWLGTQKAGAYLFTEDGTRELLHFTSHNSPLLSDNILSIAVNEENGEVFFGTDKGIISYRADATGGADFFSRVYVYPNPVREDFDGPVTITGLMKDTSVKITDVSGNLVFETTSVGGQATWDGKNLLGKRVATGVYLVFLTNQDGTQTHVTKLLFIH